MPSRDDGFEGTTALITGGAGCIGTNLITALLEKGAKKVVAIDDLSAAYRWNVPEDDRVVFYQGSVLEDEVMQRAFASKPEFVFHLAAHFANQNSIDHPDTDLLVNGLGTLKALQYANLTKVERFVFASSGCSVYGSDPPLPVPEDFVSLHLDTPYQITKLLGELYSNFFLDTYDVPTVNARFFNVYGPGEVPGRYRNVIPNFMYWAKKGLPLPITGTGKETRDFTYVADIVDGILACCTTDKVVGEAINLASGKQTEVDFLATEINALAANKAGMVHKPRRDWDKVTKRQASIDKARKILGYEPKMTMKSGLKATWNWINEHWDAIESSARF